MTGRLSIVALLVSAVAFSAEDPREILKRSVILDDRNSQLAQNYTYISHTIAKEIDQRGQVKKTRDETTDITILYGEHYSRVITRDGKPLPPAEEQKEQEKLAKFTAKFEKESETQRRKRLAEREKARVRGREFLAEIPDAFQLTLLGTELLNGRESWVIQLAPKPGFKGKARFSSMLGKVRGKLWVDKAEYQWVKAEAESTDTITYGGFLLRLYKGARITFEQARVNDEVWLPKAIYVKAAGRLALVRTGGGETTSSFSDYRKFQSDTKILSTAEVH